MHHGYPEMECRVLDDHLVRARGLASEDVVGLLCDADLHPRHDTEDPNDVNASATLGRSPVAF